MTSKAKTDYSKPALNRQLALEFAESLQKIKEDQPWALLKVLKKYRRMRVTLLSYGGTAEQLSIFDDIVLRPYSRLARSDPDFNEQTIDRFAAALTAAKRQPHWYWEYTLKELKEKRDSLVEDGWSEEQIALFDNCFGHYIAEANGLKPDLEPPY